MPSIGEYVYYLPEIYRVVGMVTPGVYRLEGMVSQIRKVATTETLYPANFRTRASGSQDKLEEMEERYRKLEEKMEKMKRFMNDMEKELTLTQEDARLYKEDSERSEGCVDRLRAQLKQEKAKTKVTERLMGELRRQFILERPLTLYEVLYVTKDASTVDIARNYKKLSMLLHPDQGGNEQFFKLINKAYRLLRNPWARAAYDSDGLEAAEAVVAEDNQNDRMENSNY